MEVAAGARLDAVTTHLHVPEQRLAQHHQLAMLST
jgi:hypothetical protein